MKLWRMLYRMLSGLIEPRQNRKIVAAVDIRPCEGMPANAEILDEMGHRDLLGQYFVDIRGGLLDPLSFPEAPTEGLLFAVLYVSPDQEPVDWTADLPETRRYSVVTSRGERHALESGIFGKRIVFS